MTNVSGGAVEVARGMYTGKKTASNKVKNINDMAGNVYEWTMESYSSDRRIYRGRTF